MPSLQRDLRDHVQGCAAQARLPPGCVWSDSEITIRQWEDEVQRFAPELRVAVYYGGNSKALVGKLGHIDILIISYQSLVQPEVMQAAKRIIIDESHIVCAKNQSSSVLAHVRAMGVRDFKLKYPKLEHKWCVSATPYVQFSDDILLRQAWFLYGFCRLNKKATLADAKAIMIRLEKDQKVTDETGKEVNIANIPGMQYDKLNVDLSADELALYRMAACVDTWTPGARSRSHRFNPRTPPMHCSLSASICGCCSSASATTSSCRRSRTA